MINRRIKRKNKKKMSKNDVGMRKYDKKPIKTCPSGVMTDHPCPIMADHPCPMMPEITLGVVTAHHDHP